MNALLAILFALALKSDSIGKYWQLPSWCPKSTTSLLTPGSDVFVKEDNYAITTNGAAAFYSVLDAYDVRKFVFSNGSANIAKHTVTSRGLFNYDEFLSRKTSLRDLACFGDSDSLAGGEAFDKWVQANGYDAFDGYDWQANPFPDPSKKAIVWFPTSRMFGSYGIFTGGTENGGIAKTVLESISYIPLDQNDWYGHDWESDSVYGEDAGNFCMFLTNSYERVWTSDMMNESRAIDWKPIEMAAKVLGTYDKLYEVSVGNPFSAITNVNSVSGSVTYKTDGSTVSRVNFKGVSPLGEIMVEDMEEGSSLPIGTVTVTNDTSVTSFPIAVSCPFADVSAVAAHGSVNASVQIGTFSVSDDWEEAVGLYIYGGEGRTDERTIISTFSKAEGFRVGIVGDEFVYTEGAVDNITAEPGLLEMSVTGSATAGYSAVDAVVSCATNEEDLCTISTNLASHVSNVNYYAFMSFTNTGYYAKYKCRKFPDRTIRGQNGFGTALRTAMQELDERVECGLEADIYDAQEYCDFSETDARSIWGSCSNLALSVNYGGTSQSVTTNYAVVVPVYIEQKGMRVNIVSGTVDTVGGIFVRLSESASIADRRDAYHGDSKCAWVSEANVGNVPIKQTSGGKKMKDYTLKLTSNTMPEGRCEGAFDGMYMKTVDAKDPVKIAKEKSFYRAFNGCTNLIYTDFSELKTAGKESFYGAFSGCKNLGHVDFSKLKTSEERSFESAFTNAHDIASIWYINFSGLTNASQRSFKGCSLVNDMPRGYLGLRKQHYFSARFNSLVFAGERSFESAFENSQIMSFDFSSLKRVGDFAFANAFKDTFALTIGNGENSIVNAYKNLETIGCGAFSNAFEGSRFVFTTNDIPSIRNQNSPFRMMASSNARNEDNGGIYFRNLITASKGSFCGAYKSTRGVAGINFPKLEYADEDSFREAFSCSEIGMLEYPALKQCGKRSFFNAFSGCTFETNVSGVSFGVLTNCDSLAFSGAFSCPQTNSHLKSVLFPNLETSGSNAFLEAFSGCTNLEYVSFNRLKHIVDGTAVDLNSSLYVSKYPVEAPLVLSCSNISESAVVDISKRKNVREIRFDTVPAIVNFDIRWIPQNADWKAYVPKDLLLAWRAADGWSAYSSNIVTTGKVFAPWVATVSGSSSGTPTGFIQDYVNQHPEHWEYDAGRDDWWWLGPSIPDPNIGGVWSFSQPCLAIEGVGADATKIGEGYFDNNGDHASVSAERSEIGQ